MMNNRNGNVKHKTKHLVLRTAGRAASEVVTVLALTKQNTMQKADSLRVTTNSCNKQTL